MGLHRERTVEELGCVMFRLAGGIVGTRAFDAALAGLRVALEPFG